MGARQGFSGKAAVVGVGMTGLSRASGRSELSLAVEASRAAIAEAGRPPDAVLSYHMNDSAPVQYVARELGVRRLGWHNEIYGGGSQAASVLGDAAMLIDAGLAETVLVYRALNGRSGIRMNTTALKLGEGTEEEFTHPYGMAGPIHHFALAAQRYLYETGLTERHLYEVVAQSRRHAAGNPRALRRTPMSFEDYQAEPMIASPLRRADCCQETDGACALIITRAALAPDAPRIHAVVRAGADSSDITEIFSAHVAAPLYEAAGMKPGDIDIALLYDAYSWLVPRQLEDFGLLSRAELPVRLNDALQTVNPHGGLLSEGYVHGLNNTAEAVRHLRDNATTALCTGFGGPYGSAAILTRP